MPDLKIIIYLLLVIFLIFGIASFMEFYKKKIRKDKFYKAEAHIISWILSGGAIACLNFLHIFIPFVNYYFPESPIWIDYIFQALIIYFLQYQADMKILKNLIKIAAIKLLTSQGINLTKEDLSKILENSDTK